MGGIEKSTSTLGPHNVNLNTQRQTAGLSLTYQNMRCTRFVVVGTPARHMSRKSYLWLEWAHMSESSRSVLKADAYNGRFFPGCRTDGSAW